MLRRLHLRPRFLFLRQHGANRVHCLRRGKYIDVAGSDEVEDCVNCASGTFSSAGSSNCGSECPAGRYSNNGTSRVMISACDECVVGKYIDVAGSDQADDCIACDVGKYIDVTGSDQTSDCITCDVGKYIDVRGSDEADDCIEVSSCGPLEFTLAGSSDCASCPDGSISPPGTISLDGCICLSIGEHRYSFDMTKGDDGDPTAQGQCITCPQRELSRAHGDLCSILALGGWAAAATGNAETETEFENPVAVDG